MRQYTVLLGGSFKRLGIENKLLIDEYSQERKMVFNFSSEDFESFKTCVLCVENSEGLFFFLDNGDIGKADILEMYPSSIVRVLIELNLEYRVIGRVDLDTIVCTVTQESYAIIRKCLRQIAKCIN